MQSAGDVFRPWYGLEWVAWLAACLLSMLLVTYPIFDFDFYWHLANGREMINTAHIISKEVFSYTHPNEHFANHEWLAQVVFYLVWNTFGPYGLFGLKLFMVGLISCLLFRMLHTESQSPGIALLLTVLVVLAGLNRFHVRPELFSLLNITLLGYILYGYCMKRLPKALLWAIPLLMVTWDWLHGAVFGFAFLTLFVSGENIKHRLNRFQHQSLLSATDLKYLNLCFTISLLAMLVNPFGLRSYGIFVGYVIGEANFNSVITEFTPVSWEFSKVYILMLAWVAFLAIRNWRQLDITQLFVGVIFALAAIRFSRMVGVAAIVLAPVIARLLRTNLQMASKNVERKLHTVTLMVAGSLMLWHGYQVKFVPDDPEPDSNKYHYVKVYDLSFGYRMDEDFYPVGAVNFIRDHKLTGHLYNSGNLGGYLSYLITPERKIFQYNMGRVFGDPLYYARHPNRLEQWNINYAIVGTEMEMNLFPDREWATVYRDETALLLVRRTPQHAALIAKNEVYYFSPVLSDTSLLAQANDPRVLPELAAEMGNYLNYRKDRRIAQVWAKILATHENLRKNDHIQELLNKALKYNPDTKLKSLLHHPLNGLH